MDRKLASIQKIVDLRPIEGADFIEQATVLGWNVIVKKGDFALWDLCVFFEIDSLLPADNPEFSFMEKHRFKVRTMKMKGVVSQGLALSMEILPKMSSESYFEGDDVTALLNISKYEPPQKFFNSPII